jgi:hypothetical protein
LDAAVSDWIDTRKSAYPSAKLLVVAPNIHQAGIYAAHLSRRKVHNLIATSDDSDAAATAIARFKGDQTPGVDALVTVAMAYEGLSVPQISHIACLTHIRSLPWLEQCFARGNRCSPGKQKAVVYGPEDPRFMDAIRAIEREQVAAICARNAMQEREGAAGEGEEGGGGAAKPKITPLSSIAYASEIVIPMEPEAVEMKGISHSAAETLLRQQIATHIELFISAQRPGARHPYQLVITRKLKELVGRKARSECSVEELTRQWAYLKAHYPLGMKKWEIGLVLVTVLVAGMLAGFFVRRESVAQASTPAAPTWYSPDDVLPDSGTTVIALYLIDEHPVPVYVLFQRTDDFQLWLPVVEGATQDMGQPWKWGRPPVYLGDFRSSSGRSSGRFFRNQSVAMNSIIFDRDLPSCSADWSMASSNVGRIFIPMLTRFSKSYFFFSDFRAGFVSASVFSCSAIHSVRMNSIMFDRSRTCFAAAASIASSNSWGSRSENCTLAIPEIIGMNRKRIKS